MTFRYNENPFLFVNSTGSSVPQGRNVRAASRTQQAAQQAPGRSQEGQFAVLDFALENQDGSEETKKGRKSRRKVPERRNGATVHLQRLRVVRANEAPKRCLTMPDNAPLSPPSTINPSEILALATFHIRRLAAMTVQIQPNRLVEVLRCRQWSCMSIALDRVGQDPCLDSALVCVASKLGQITCGKALPYPVLSTYSDALQQLQSALQEPETHNHSDLVTSTQLLAVYEMLDSLDNKAWVKHVAGAESLSLSKLRTPSFTQGRSGVTLSETAAMFADAL